MGYSSGKDSDYGYSSKKDSDSYSATINSYSSNSGYTPTKASSKLAVQLIKAMEEKQELMEQRLKNDTAIAKADKKIQDLLLSLKDDPNFSEIIERLLVLRP